MKTEEFMRKVLSASSKFAWIKRSEVRRIKDRVRMRLWLNESSFIDVYYNAEKAVISYAYIESGKRLFGANNMRIGWHLHPFQRAEEHVPIQQLSTEEFLRILEEELKKRNKIQ